MTPAVNTAETLRERIRTLDALPTMPTILRPLLEYMERPVDEMDVVRLTELIGSDTALAAQCMRMANSPLYGRRWGVDSLRGAVVALGMRRLREILLSCVLLRLVPQGQWALDPVCFWEHSFGCALVSRQLALRIGWESADKAYLAGLLHDIGAVAAMLVFPAEFAAAMQTARAQHLLLEEVEHSALGITHAEAGEMLAEHWRLPEFLREAIRWHHDVQQSRLEPVLVAVVSLADQLCRMRGLGYGYYEPRQVDFLSDPAWHTLVREYPHLHRFDLARFTFEMDEYLLETRALVASVFRA